MHMPLSALRMNISPKSFFIDMPSIKSLREGMRFEICYSDATQDSILAILSDLYL